MTETPAHPHPRRRRHRRRRENVGRYRESERYQDRERAKVVGAFLLFSAVAALIIYGMYSFARQYTNHQPIEFRIKK